MGLDLVEMVVRIEKDFDVTLRDDELVHVTTVGSLHDLLLAKLHVSPSVPRAEAIWRELQAIVVTELGVPPEAVTPTARLYEDLGAN